MIRLIKPYIDFHEISHEIEEVFDSGIFTKGKYSRRFPSLIKEYVGAKHAFLTTSATTALTMSLKLLGIGPGDEVAVSDFSFPASANVVEDLGATTVLIDVSRDTFNMLSEDLEQRISAKTKAVIFVDALGNPSGLEMIYALCKAYDIPLIEDAACAIGSKVNGVNCGALADLTCFSFHPRKLLTCGEGGAITTNNDAYAQSLLIKLNHGADESGDFVNFGFNYRMPELACLMGCAQITKIDAIVTERRKQSEQYAARLIPLGFKQQKAVQNAYHNMQSIVFIVPEGVDRDRLHDYLFAKDIETTIGTYCLSETPYYREKYHDIRPNASFLQHNTITLPCFHNVSIREVCDAIESFFPK